MLVQAQSTEKWEDIFIKKFSSFCKKSPVLLSMQSNRVQDGEKGVLITHENTGKKYFIPYDYDIDVKDFIAKIKKLLVANHYPRLVESCYEQRKKTPEQLAIEAEKTGSTDLKSYEVVLTGHRVYRIDKVISWRKMAILSLEQSDFSEDVIGTEYKYRYNKIITKFLSDYRSGKFKSIEEASDEFFSHALLLSEMKKGGNDVSSNSTDSE